MDNYGEVRNLIAIKKKIMSNLKVTLEVDELAGCLIERDDERMQWENLSRKEQVQILNSFAQFYKLFYKCLKEEEG